jgi:hypothetical protein
MNLRDMYHEISRVTYPRHKVYICPECKKLNVCPMLVVSSKGRPQCSYHPGATMVVEYDIP